MNSNLCLRITTGDITEIIGALPVGKYAGYYSSGATGTPSSYGTFEAVVMNNTTATITAIGTSSGENYINVKTSNTWKGWERDITNTDLQAVNSNFIKLTNGQLISQRVTLELSKNYNNAAMIKTFNLNQYIGKPLMFMLRVDTYIFKDSSNLKPVQIGFFPTSDPTEASTFTPIATLRGGSPDFVQTAVITFIPNGLENAYIGFYDPNKLLNTSTPIMFQIWNIYST